MRREQAYLPIKGAVIGEAKSGLAILVRFNESGDLLGDTHDHWIPRSVCEEGDDLAVGDNDIRVAEWWLNKEGLF